MNSLFHFSFLAAGPPVLKEILNRATPEELKELDQWQKNIAGSDVLFINDNSKARSEGNKTQNIFEKPLMLYRVIVESWSDSPSTIEEWGFGSGVLPRFLLTPEGNKLRREYVGWDKDKGQYEFVVKACKDLAAIQMANALRPVVPGDSGNPEEEQ